MFSLAAFELIAQRGADPGTVLAVMRDTMSDTPAFHAVRMVFPTVPEGPIPYRSVGPFDTALEATAALDSVDPIPESEIPKYPPPSFP